jgi:hypothetical protein
MTSRQRGSLVEEEQLGIAWLWVNLEDLPLDPFELQATAKPSSGCAIANNLALRVVQDPAIPHPRPGTTIMRLQPTPGINAVLQ